MQRGSLGLAYFITMSFLVVMILVKRCSNLTLIYIFFLYFLRNSTVDSMSLAKYRLAELNKFTSISMRYDCVIY